MTSLQETPTLVPRQRAGLLLLATALTALLVVAWRLEPDRRGFGTHEQLGLPPCALRRLTGMRCPSCGMTTAWAHLTHGRVGQAVASNLGGTLLAILGILAVPWLLISAAANRYVGFRPSPTGVFALSSFLLLTTLADWFIRWSIGWRG